MKAERNYSLIALLLHIFDHEALFFCYGNACGKPAATA